MHYSIQVKHFLLDSRVGGPQIYVDNLCKSSNGNINYEIYACGSKKNNKYQYKLLNLRLFFKYLYVIEILLNAVLIILSTLRRFNKNPVIYHVHGSANLAPLIVSRILNIPTIWHLHETDEFYKKFVAFGTRFIISKKTKIAVVARRSIKTFQLSSDAVYIPAGIDLDFWSISDYELKNKVIKSKIDIILICNISPIKGLDNFLRSLFLINTKNIINIEIIGSSLKAHMQYYESVKNIATKLPSNFSVKFSGWQNQNYIRCKLKTADVFVLSSLSEACPLSLIEALSMGVFSIATNVGDVEEILKHYKNGLIAPDSSVKGFASTLSFVLLNKKYEKNEIQIKKSIWDIKYISSMLNTIYIEILKDEKYI